MQPNGSGTGIESPALTPQEAAQTSMKSLIDRIEQHCSVISNQDRRNVRTIHQLRVDIRRTLAAVQIFQDLLPEAEVAWLRKKMRQLRKLSSPIRDRDVLSKRLRGLSLEAEDHKNSAKSLRIAVRCIRCHRNHLLKMLQRKTRRLVRKGSLSRHRDSLLLGLATPASRFSQTDLADGYSVLIDRLRAMAQDCLDATAFDKADLDSLHRFRLKMKTFRYSLEILIAYLPRNAVDELLSLLSDLQINLGNINDHRFAWQGLKGLSCDFKRREQRVLKKLAQKAKRELKSSLKQFQELWTIEFQQRLRDQINAVMGS